MTLRKLKCATLKNLLTSVLSWRVPLSVMFAKRVCRLIGSLGVLRSSERQFIISVSGACRLRVKHAIRLLP